MSGLLADFLDPLLTDPVVADLIGTKVELQAMLSYEVALAEAEAEWGIISKEAAAHIVKSARSFAPDLVRLSVATLRDGVVVTDFVKQLKVHVGPPCADWVHFGATSQDVTDTVLAMKLRGVLDLFDQRLVALLGALDRLATEFGATELMGRTRMQAAIPITVGDRLAVWRGLVERGHVALGPVRAHMLVVSLAGPAGTSERFGSKINDIRHSLAGCLKLGVPDYVPHAARDRIAALGNWLSQVTGALGKIGQDIALMAQNELGEMALEGGGTSSAMAHKQNPVRAEVLVALARFNAVQVSGLHQALVHEQERSGAAWTLEWLVLPQMLNATGIALVHADALLGSIRRMGK
ncbi:3-carboxy-cis,cis-muconate cycloisomerase [Rhizobium sp. KVB221]|uniref:3-carboxy-cis,cis-muconate cycloisomerase n=1 Tax=Rhizobium setariae TaxID=2801340 RepID=A0A936YNY7_9HYPH|nr:3-carboxy-cis,cis-muconate cycloisomerase [Rhizobium setariae]MBL0371771.1 3-carboxy-cis,cis-muconate cycloisomerase [Rhizobium setariae]